MTAAELAELARLCCCAGYTTKLEDSNLPWHAAIAKAQARIAELEAALRLALKELEDHSFKSCARMVKATLEKQT